VPSPPTGVAVRVKPVGVVEGLKDRVPNQLVDLERGGVAEVTGVGECVPLPLTFTTEVVPVDEGDEEVETHFEGVAP
jgi:hypothetical protein